MKTKEKDIQGQQGKTRLRSIPGLKESLPKLSALAASAWTITHAFVFSRLQFTGMEKQKAIAEIYQYILEGSNPEKGYRTYLERIVLYTCYAEEPMSNLLPSLWLSPAAKTGFAKTASSIQQIEMMRESIPAYRVETKALAEALQEMSEHPSPQNFIYWKDYFTLIKQERLLELFCIACAHLQFNHYSKNHV